MRILIVEDEPDIRELLQLILEADLGADVDQASNGQRALEVLEAGLPDLVLTDLRMPKMDGMELLAAIQQRWPDLPCIVVSAYLDPPLLKQAKALGARDVVRKPFDSDDLVARIRAALGAS